MPADMCKHWSTLVTSGRPSTAWRRPDLVGQVVTHLGESGPLTCLAVVDQLELASEKCSQFCRLGMQLRIWDRVLVAVLWK